MNRIALRYARNLTLCENDEEQSSGFHFVSMAVGLEEPDGRCGV